MKKTFLLLFLAVFTSAGVFADDVSEGQALAIASEFAARHAAPSRGARRAPAKVAPRLAHTVKSEVADKSNVYVVDLGGGQGFVVVSGESGTGDKILGYCDHGAFSYADAPVQFKTLLGNYSASIDLIRNDRSLASKASKAPYGVGSVIVGPLLTTRWNQTAPYNNMCPDGAYTGCVPTAVAQLMNYWKWPKQSKGEVDGTDFSGHVYDWDNMLDIYGLDNETHENIPYNSVQAAAVAKLMADVGKAFGTRYLPGGSPTPFSDLALSANFGYNQETKIHTGATAAELQNVMKAELDLRRPILYAGNPASGQGDGHAMVCNGYTSNGYFHFNYGWGGACDGYYKHALIALFPANCMIITGVRPYDAVYKTIDNIEYGLHQNGTAEILRYNKPGEHTHLVIPDSVTDDGNSYKVTNVKATAFTGSKHFSKVTFGKNIESIELFSFASTTIDTLILNDKIKVIPEAAFINAKIKSLTIGASVTRIEKQAFCRCLLFDVKCKSPEIEFVGEEAFLNCKFENVEWLDCIRSIGSKAFYAATFKKVPTFTNLESVGSKGFYGSAFAKASTMWPEFVVSKKLRHIEPDAFDRSNLGKFTVDGGNPYFSSSEWPLLLNKNQTCLIMTAAKWPSLIDFPSTMIRMGPGSIMNSSFSITIPNTVVEMEGALVNYTLHTLKCNSVVPPIITDSSFHKNMFNEETWLYVPKGCEELYRNAPGWNRFTHIIGDLKYVPAPDQDREYYMVMHGSDEQGRRVSMPVSGVDRLEISGGDTPSVVVSRKGGESITTGVAQVDSITWMRGFVYESAEVFELNDSVRTAVAQKCSVSLSPTTVDDNVQLCIRNSVLTPDAAENCVRGLAVDVSLSNDVHELSGTAEIVIPMQRGEKEKVQAAYYNAESGRWEPVMFRYDNARQAVVITTDHLSTFSAFVIQDDNTSRARLNLLYDECPMFFDLNEALGKMLAIVSDEAPDEAAVQAWRDDFDFWQSVGLDGGHSMLSSLGFSNEVVGNAIDAVGYVGTAATVLDVIASDLKGDAVGTASNTLKTIMGFASGQLASAVGTSIMQASMGVAAFIGVVLEKFGTKVQEAKHDLFHRAYRFYYSKDSKRVVGGQSKFGAKYYRTEKDWYEYFYPAFTKPGMTDDRLRAYIEQSVRRYCDRFWEESDEVFTFCMAEKDVHSLSTYMRPDESMMQQMSDEHFAELMNGTLTSVFQAIKKNLEVQGMKRYQSAVRNYMALMNANVGLRIFDSSWKEGGKSKYAGYRIRLSEIPETVEDPQRYERTINEQGKANIGYFTVYSLIKNKMKCRLTLFNADDEEKAFYEFHIPAGTGKLICNIDLATGESTTIVPKLKDLELEYKPNALLSEYTLYRKGINDIVSDPNEEKEIGAMLYLDNLTGHIETRFQTEIAKFFKKHDLIIVDHAGNIRIGDDIIGKFDANKLQGRGKFTINVSYPFVEKTKMEFLNQNKKVKSILDTSSSAYINLLNGTIQHKIDCDFTVSRSTDGEEYFVNYTGIGSYKLNAEVVNGVYHVGWYNTDVDFSETQLDDITTRQMETEGTVKLSYKTKLR